MSTLAADFAPGMELESGELEHLHVVRDNQRKALKRALFLSAMSHLSAITLVLVIALIQRTAAKSERIVVVPYRELQAPPSLQETPPTVSVAAPTAAPTAGIPLPTEDEQVEQEQTIATQEELSQTIGAGETGGDSLVIAPPSDALPAFGEYVYVEEMPEAITKVQPEYPDIARQANMEGTVMIQALVGKDGRVKDVKVVRSVSVLDDAAVAAVKKWVFKPALSNNKPVAVWVAVPVKFTLH